MTHDHDIDILARTLMGEAKAGDEESAVAIAHVVMNRVAYRNWPGTVAEVCLQPWQFSCWNQNDPNRARILGVTREKSPWFRQCHEIAAMVINGGGADPTNGATHYHTPSVHPAWAKKHKPCFTHFHLYYNDIDTPAPESATEALQEVRPLHKTRTVKGGQAATLGVLGSGLFADLQDKIAPLVPYSDYLKYLFLAIALAGIGMMVYARIRDRQEGLR